MNLLNAEYWDKRHLEGDTPWNIKMPSPPISAYIDQINDKKISILIPGAGHAHDAAYLIERGFKDITVCDISEVAIQKMKSQMNIGSKINYQNVDFFALEGTFDLILEQTFFCAIDPSLRKKYVDKMYTLLKPEGTLAGILFGVEFPYKGPPFGGSISEYKSLFNAKLHIQTIEICYNSIPQRSGNELFFICKKLEF
jgi:SAM-dependent methyltransferase